MKHGIHALIPKTNLTIWMKITYDVPRRGKLSSTMYKSILIIKVKTWVINYLSLLEKSGVVINSKKQL